MTFRQLLFSASEKLGKSEILFCETPFLDASILLSFAAGISREQLFASYPEEVSLEIEIRFEKLLTKRLSGLPVSYIRNIKEFFGRDFFVDQSVLVPRPDTEVIIEKTLELAGTDPRRVLDLCTGSGCIGISLKLENSSLNVCASDISSGAIETARRNAKNLNAEIEFIQSSLFDNINGKFNIIVTNPPYLTSKESTQLCEKGWPEPQLALDGGTDGLDLIRIIIDKAMDYLEDNGYLLIEAGPKQADSISKKLLTAGFSDVETTRDMAGRARVTSGKKNG